VVVHPSGKFVYGSNRGHDSIAVFVIDKDGELSLVDISKIEGKTPRNFNVDPSGQYLLAEGQASNTVHVFRIDETTGRLSLVGEPLKVPSPVCAKFLVVP
jgi:6-phosphogluconolactonase